MRALCLFVLGLSVAAQAIAANVISPAPEDIELTIYRDRQVDTRDLRLNEDSGTIAMVTETRTIDLASGTSTLEFRGVAAGIVPQTAKLFGAPVTIVESNFDYNLLTPGTLIEKSLGKSVRLISTDTSTGRTSERRGTLRSGPSGVVIDFDGRFEALSCSGWHERLVLDDVPQSLTDTPTLSLVVRAPAAGRHRVQLSYLTLGLDWSADYVADMRPDERTLDLSAWITLVNRRETAFANATTHVVAGTLSRVENETQPPATRLPELSSECWPIGEFALRRRLVEGQLKRALPFPADVSSPAEIVVTAMRRTEVSDLGDYKLYSLPETTTVASKQIKEVRLLQRSGVRFEHLYEYRLNEAALDERAIDHPNALLRLENDARSGLGVPLPGGTVMIMDNEGNRRVLVGMFSIQDTPIGQPLELRYGRATDISISLKVAEDSAGNSEDNDVPQQRGTLEVSVANAQPVPIRLEIHHGFEQRAGFRIVKSSHRPTTRHGEPVWTLRLRPGQREVLRYTIEQAE